MSEATQAAWSCARGKHKASRHIKFTSVFKIWHSPCVVCGPCTWLHKKEFYCQQTLWVSITWEGVRQLGTRSFS